MGIHQRRQRRLALLAEAERTVPITFAIVGVQKAGTSSLYQMLTQHRMIVGGAHKELRFFIEPHDWDNPDYSTYRRPAWRRQQREAGDATPGYLFYPHAIERMHGYDPDLKLLASFRDPIERAFSHWAMERRRRDTYPDLPAAIEQYGADELPTSAHSDAVPTPLLRRSPFARGLYGAQLERAMAFFPAEQWLMVEFGSLIREPHAVLDRATDLLGVARFRDYPALVTRMAGSTTNPGPRPSAGAVEGLVRRYADDLALFERLSGLDISGWPTRQAAAGTLDVTELRDRLCDKLGLQA
ncbi:hypothetical protein [Nocardioides sp.]|jgi:hypothetical protein|uniref:hypothetical protein n=1 Tax=Nocardioides sp. TaxID=35761 RepID=UPI002F41C0AE